MPAVPVRCMSLCAVATLLFGLFSAPPARADLPCGEGEVHSKAIPPRDQWQKGEPTRNLTKADQSWVKEALGFDWRLMYTDTFAFIPMLTKKEASLFFIQRWDPEWCGSGGCAMMLYDCTLEQSEQGKCTEIWSSWKKDVWFPGSGDEAHPDFITGGRDLYTWDDGKYKPVCNVTVNIR